ncbi:phosphoribosylglycinamide formyltransferase [Rhodococcus sp. BP-252]|nr:phosphoribosylglycinamide formyltransferase [Rhodococcus sp. BP-320]MBY6417675.1 phosphoribosylglycinamide formyltransferase [Rhodococcus sp. BP-321]MBY6423301.1 phosphoribosylglycinamide formyltransferase [Rhodococcus sp. BP-324]MBY6427904.1 phosphoribosylglycinamide formyltransferase [Rhodococcus sp. BP-323]MBY6431903.1 phosphoribosylglycinamide formyltransferase [Rhodococcus sp. BP-322]MBY6442011.1 phosphoribosylglycinamide formyltransferase [Rhodococcus sp. BP-319]MBY6446879.1 phosphor
MWTRRRARTYPRSERRRNPTCLRTLHTAATTLLSGPGTDTTGRPPTKPRRTALTATRVHPARVVVLASGTGSLLKALIDAAQGDYPARIVAVGVDRDCDAARHAHTAGIEHVRVGLRDYADRAEWDAALAETVAKYEPDLVVTAGFMKILGPRFLDAFAGRIVNTHPALLPSFPGAHAVRDALEHGVKLTGSTVHLVDAGVDTGPILAQEAVPVQEGDDEASLHERIKTVERRLLVEVIAAVATRGVVSDGRKAQIRR